MDRLDLQLIIDNSIKGYHRISSQLLAGDNINKIKAKEESYPDGVPMKNKRSVNHSVNLSDIFNETFGTDIELSEKDWSQLFNMFEALGGENNVIHNISGGGSGEYIEGNVIRSVKYNSVPYYEMVYAPQKYSNAIPSRDDIKLLDIVGGDIELFKSISSNPNNNLGDIIAGSSTMKEDDISNIESFFEIYDSDSSLLTGKIEDISRWKDINSYDEFLQQPILREGKDFMNKFLDIQTRVEAGEIIPRQEIETLIPSYMKDGESLLESAGDLKLTPLSAVDPNYSQSSYILSKDTSDIAKDIINMAFLRSFSVVRMSTLADLKNIINKIGSVVRQINRMSKVLVTDGGEQYGGNVGNMSDNMPGNSELTIDAGQKKR